MEGRQTGPVKAHGLVRSKDAPLPSPIHLAPGKELISARRRINKMRQVKQAPFSFMVELIILAKTNLFVPPSSLDVFQDPFQQWRIVEDKIEEKRNDRSIPFLKSGFEFLESC